MHHVKLHLDPLNRGVRLCHIEPRLLGRAIDRHQRVKEVQMGIIFFDVFHQGRYVVLNPEQNTTGIVEMDVDVFEHTATVPCIA